MKRMHTHWEFSYVTDRYHIISGRASEHSTEFMCTRPIWDEDMAGYRTGQTNWLAWSVGMLSRDGDLSAT